MQLSRHASIRSRQRAISGDFINLIINFGTAKRKPGGALEYRLNNKDRDKIIKYCKYQIQLLDKITGKAVLVDSNTDEIITVYNLI